VSKSIKVGFVREFTRGFLTGIKHADEITMIDRWHAAQWLKGVRRNSRCGKLDYRVVLVTIKDSHDNIL
jgi:hypothetical protein